MNTILLINPNTSARSLRMMLTIARAGLPAGMALRGVSAASGAAMIVNDDDLAASAREVVRLGVDLAPDVATIVVAASIERGTIIFGVVCVLA